MASLLTSNDKRTKYCGEFTAADVGSEVCVMGWCQRQRDLGGLIFIDLRDRSGIVQLAFDNTEYTEAYDTAFTVRSEFVLCAKGIELKTGLLLSEVVHEINPNQTLAVLSGPGFAVELARQCPTAVTIASKDISLAKELCSVLKTDYFRPYSSSDMITPQVCGALKNVMAIASGISDGCQFGDNARAALITRGLAEMARFAVMLGGQRESVAGLSGVGDLMLTANSHQSRNYSCGFEIGQAGWAKPVLEKSTKTVEGVATAESVLKRAGDLKIEMPICQVVEEIIYHEKPIKEALLDLLNRPLKTEQEF